MDTNLKLIPGDLGDARFNNYILEHGHRYLTRQVDSFWDAPFMHPAKNVIAFSDNLLGTLPIYSLFRLANFDRETAFQLWILSLFALNFICCYLLLKKWSNDIILASTGAYIFAFSIYLFGHITNAQIFPKFIIPFVFYWCWQYQNKRQLKYFLFTGLGIAFQFYCGMYLGFYLTYALFLFFISYLIIYRDKSFLNQFKEPKIIIWHLLILAVTVLILLPLAIPYIKISELTGYRAYADVESSIPLLQSYFLSPEPSLIWRSLLNNTSFTKMYWCHTLFTGITAWLGVIGLPFVLTSKKVPKSSITFVSFIGLSLLLSILGCLNFNNHSLYYYIHAIPGFDSIRAVNRIINVEIIFFVLILTFVLGELKKYYSGIKYFIYLLPVIVVVDNLIIPSSVSRFKKQQSNERVAAVVKEITRQINKSDKPIAYIPLKLQDREYELYLDIMLACQDLKLKCVNGYSGSTPNSLIDFYNNGTVESLKKWCDYNKIDISGLNLVYETDIEFQTGEITKLKASNGMYVCADQSNKNLLSANRNQANEWESFRMIRFGNQKCAFISNDHFFVCAELSMQSQLIANRYNRSNWETFKIIQIDSTHVAFMADNGKYVTVDPGTSQLFARSDSIGYKEIFSITSK